ncbi:MAG: hypothetical protein KDJ47_06625 [Hyphomicrobiaceae bacterium]|nr:hypothetical protein [Hyphomicrobiaceae bacterium]
MIYSLSGIEREQQPELFEQLFRLRYDVFVKQRLWALPSCGGLEIDNYDTPEAQYFFGVDDGGKLVSHARLTPTLTQSLLADVFPHLVEQTTAVRDPAVYEVTRYIVPPKRGRRSLYTTAKAELMLAALEWCKQLRITHLHAVVDSAALPSFIEACSEVRPMGLPQSYGGGQGVPGGGETVAVRCAVTDRAIRDVKSFGGLGMRQRDISSDGYFHSSHL